MSAELERAFSAAKTTPPDRRCRMEDDAIEALDCLKSLQRDGLMAASREDIKVIEDMLNALSEEDLGRYSSQNTIAQSHVVAIHLSL